MIRSHAISLMLMVALCSPAAAARPRLRHRAYCQPVCCKPACCKLAFPTHCLQQKWLDYTGTNDLYICVTEYGPDCYDDVEEELWYGAANSDPVQHCEEGDCEPGDARKGPLLGHGLVLSESDAWNNIKPKLVSAGIPTGSMAPKFYKLDQNLDAGIARPIYFIAVPITIPSGPMRGRTRYLGVETEQIPEGHYTPATPTSIKVGPGAQLKGHLSADTQRLTALIWLK